MTNQLQLYTTEITAMVLRNPGRFSQEETVTLDRLRTFLINLNDLMNPTAGINLAQVAAQQAVSNPSHDIVGLVVNPAPPVIQQIANQAGPVAPVPNGAAPAAVKLSSLTQPEVTGCIAAQPQPVKQAAAQAELDKYLAEKKAQDDLEAQLRQQMEAKQVSLEESLRKQIEEKKVMETTPENSDAPKGQMTLEQFEAFHAKKEQDDKQALLDSLLGQTAAVVAPEIQQQ